MSLGVIALLGLALLVSGSLVADEQAEAANRIRYAVED